MIHRDIIQGSPEWFDIKRGKVSATGLAKLQAGGKGKTRASYKLQLVLERLTGTTAETYQSASMARGNELEPVARQLYAERDLVKVEEVGFIDHPFIPDYGISPDGLVGSEGMCEIKVVEPQTMLEYINDGEIPKKYQAQMQSQMSCLPEAEWNDFVAYCPEMPEHLQLLVIRLHRDNGVIQEQEVDVVAFLNEVSAEVERLMELSI